MLKKGDLLVIEDESHILWDFEVVIVNQFNRTVTGFLIKDGKRFGNRRTVSDYQIQAVNEQ